MHTTSHAPLHSLRLSLCLVLLASCQPLLAGETNLFLLVGQSNMSGRGTKDASSDIAHPRVLSLGSDMQWRAATDPMHWDETTVGVGPGKIFAETIADNHPDMTIGLIPAAVGGSPISTWTNGATFTPFYGTGTFNPYDDAIARANIAMSNGTLKAILWHQGESDSTSALAPLYEARLSELITRFRTDLAAPDLPFYIGQLGQFATWSVNHSVVDQAQRNVARTMTNVYYVSSDRLTDTGDNLHFRTTPVRILGQRYAAAYDPPLSPTSFTFLPLWIGTHDWDGQRTWSGGFPNAIDATANLDVNLAGAQTINLNRTITVGTINLGDYSNTGPRQGWFATTIAANGGSLVMDTTAGNVLIAKPNTTDRAEDKISADILLNDNLTLHCVPTYNLATTARLTIDGVISGTGKSVEKTGAGIARFSADQLYDGGTTISAGTLELGSGTAGGNGSVIGTITNNATLTINNADAQTLSSATYSGTGIFKKIGPGTLSLTGAWNLGGSASSAFHVGYNAGSAATILDASTTPDFNVGTITTPLSKFLVGVALGASSGSTTGIGTLKLGASNTIYASQVTVGGTEPEFNAATGNAGLLTTATDSVTTINAANMAIGTAKATGTLSGQLGGAFTHGNGATLNLGASGARTALTLGRNTVTTNPGAGTMNLAGVASGTAGTGVANLYLNQLYLAYQTKGSTSLTGTLTLSDSASNNLNIVGNSDAGGVVQLGYNSAGGTTAATLTIGNLGSSSAITSGDNGTAILIARKGSGTSTGTFTLKAGTLSITTTGAAITGGGGTSRLYLGETGNVTLKAGTNSTDWITGLTTAEIKSGGLTQKTGDKSIGISQAFSGAGGLTKTGSGTLGLTGTNSFTGSILVAEGTLVGDRGSSGGGALTNQATLSPGGAAMANFMHTGPVVLTSGSTLRMDLGGDTYDAVSAGGAVTVGGTLELAVGVDLTLSSYPLITGTSLTGTFSATNGLPANANIDYTATGVVLTYTPSTPPGTPTGLTATAGDKQVALRWPETTYAAGYNLWRSTTEGGTYTLVSNLSGIGNTNYTDTGLVNLTTYYYKVSATNGAGESARSTSVSAMPTSRKDLLTFAFPGMPATVIDTNAATVTLTLALWTNVTALSPTYTLSPGAASGSPVSGTTRNFTSPQTYTVTGEDGTTKNYTVTVNMPAASSGKDILSFVFPGSLATTIDTNAATVTVTAPFWADVTALSPTYTLSQYATCVPASGTTRNFTTPQTYTVTAQDSSTKVYTVTVNKEASPGTIPPPVITKLGDGTIRAAFTNGSGMWTVPGNITNVRVLVVGGGGSGRRSGGVDGCGGGSGGLTYYTNYTVTAGSSVPIVVGVGGAAITTVTSNGLPGGTSVFATLTAAGGEGGKNRSGGNSGGLNTNGVITVGGLGGNYDGCNGGGGAGGNGGGGYDYAPGGIGIELSITGTNTKYAGGGGGNGGGHSSIWGGGAGKSGEPGVDGLGGGGGAGFQIDSGKGGDGVVILVYDAPPAGTVILLR